MPAAMIGLTAGLVLAHRTEHGTALPRLSTSRVAPRPRAATPPKRREEISLTRARLHRGRELVQQLDDGSRVTFTVDPELQARALRMLRTYELPHAGIVMYDLRSEEVLVMAGHSQAAPGTSLERLCLQPWAPAASVFKLVTAGALLERGVPSDVGVCYHGGLHGLHAEHLANNPARDGRCDTLSGAIARSINPIMAKLAVRYLDHELLGRWAGRFGFGRPLPFELPVAPSRAAIPGERLEFARAAAGFWHTELSVLHGAMIAGMVANGGALRVPRIVREIRDAQGKQLPLGAPGPAQRVLKRESARALARMMAATAQSGTARRAFRGSRRRPALPGGFTVAGKTGSLSRQSPFLHYNWFVGFAPVDRPQVAFAVLLGNPARWRIKATAAARMLLQDYLQLRSKPRAQRGELISLNLSAP